MTKLCFPVATPTTVATLLATGPAAAQDAAAAATVKDPKLRDEAAKAKLELDTMPGDKLATVAASVFDAPPAVIERAATLTARPKKKSKK